MLVPAAEHEARGAAGLGAPDADEDPRPARVPMLPQEGHRAAAMVSATYEHAAAQSSAIAPVDLEDSRGEATMLFTKALTGVRGIASLHIGLGHALVYARGVGIDLMGGGSMGLFFIISGFVMTCGYGLRPLRADRRDGDEAYLCCPCCEGCCCHFCDTGRFYCSADVDDSDPLNSEFLVPGGEKPRFRDRPFLRKRCARLYPVYALSCIVALILILASWFTYAPEREDGASQADHVGAVAIRTALSIVLGTSYVGFFPLNGAAWTISTMFFFYLVYPAIAPRMHRVPSTREEPLAIFLYVVQGTVLMCLMAVNYWFRASPFLRLPVFVIGCACAVECFRRVKEIRSNYQPRRFVDDQCSSLPLCCVWAATVAFGIFISIVGRFNPNLAWLAFVYRVLSECWLPLLFYGMLRALVLEETRSQIDDAATSCAVRLFSSRPLQLLGEISFSYYMVHMLVLGCCALADGPHGDAEDRDAQFDATNYGLYGPDPTYSAKLIPLTTVFSLFLGYLLTFYVEKPLAKRLRSPRGG